MAVISTSGCPPTSGWSENGNAGMPSTTWNCVTSASPPPPLPLPPGQAFAASPPPPSQRLCSNTCQHAADGDCDDGGAGAEFTSCEYGTDCTDCGFTGRACVDQAHTGIVGANQQPFSCPMLFNDCNHATLRLRILAACPQTCGLCGHRPPSPPPPCIDLTQTGFTLSSVPASCAQLSPHCQDAQYGQGIRTVCPSTCGTCDIASPPPATPPPLFFDPPPPPFADGGCHNACQHAADGDCDDGGVGAEFSECAHGSDCADCGVRGGGCTNTCEHSSDGECDDGGNGAEYSSCVIGSDCRDCGERGGAAAAAAAAAAANSRSANPGDSGCCGDITISAGDASAQPTRTGSFLVENGRQHNSRPVFKNVNNEYLFFCASSSKWGVGPTPDEQCMIGIRSASLSSSVCPIDASGWEAYLSGAWTSASIAVTCSPGAVHTGGGSPSVTCSNECTYTNDGECDDGGQGAEYNECQFALGMH